MEWTTERRYQAYKDWDNDRIQTMKEKISHSTWRLNYHIQPNTGLLNDPNGFSYFDGKWHIFYQSFPMGPVHGLKSWHHLTSCDLMNWEDLGLALLPDTQYDSHGVYSGSALPVNQQLFLMYTGNVRDKDWNRQTYQLGAWMDKDNTIQKIEKPLIIKPDEYTEHFRDPQVFKYNDEFLCVIGAQDLNKHGKVVFFKSKDLENWTLQGELQFTKETLGYMVECPNFVFVDGKPVLLFCPQGLDKTVKNYKNIYPNMYVIGDTFDVERVTMENVSPFENLDEGFDVYATQAFNAPDGRVLEISWIGLPDISYPSDTEEWAHCLSLVKELSIKDGHLYQYPAHEVTECRGDKQEQTGKTIHFDNTKNSYELEVTLPKNYRGTFYLYANDCHTQALKISIDVPAGTLEVDRKNAGVAVATEYDTIRTLNFEAGMDTTINLWADTSVFELYVNKGYRTLTGRVFPNHENNQIYIEGTHEISATCYHMDKTLLNKEG